MIKKIFQTSVLSLLIVGCSSLNIEAIPSTDTETKRILALDLSHQDNLNLAKKIKDKHTRIVVIGKLKSAEIEKNQAERDEIDSEKFAQEVLVSNDNNVFIGPEVKNRKTIGLLIESDLQKYFIRGERSNNGLIENKLYFSVSYKSAELRNYNSANLCDKWQTCVDIEDKNIDIVSAIVSNCTSNSCENTETIAFNLSDEFVKDNLDSGFSIRFNSKRTSNKIDISSAYLKGYIKVAD